MLNQIGQSPEPEPTKNKLSFVLNPLRNQDGHLVRLFVIMVLVFITMSIISPNIFLTYKSFSSMAFQFPELGILSLAMMITMISGGIDLSIVGIANLSAIVAAMLMVQFIPVDASLASSIPMIIFVMIIALCVGLLCGLFNGFAVAKIGIPPILVTLGSMQLFMGIGIILTQGRAVIGIPEIFSSIGNGSFLKIPFPLIMFVICIVITYFFLNKRVFGLKLYMLGANPTAAKYSGINNTSILLKTYAMSGMLAAAAGLLIVARTNSANADYGTSYILQAILVAVMGGVNYKGGVGKIAGIVMAVITLQFLSSGLNTLHVGNFFKDFMWGAVLLLFMVLNEVSKRWKLKNIINRRRIT